MDKFRYLIWFSLKKRVMTKSFLISNIVMFIVIMLLTNIVTIINIFGGDFNDTTSVYVIDETNESYESFSEGVLSITELSCAGCYQFEEATEVDREDVAENDSIYIVLKSDPKLMYTLNIVSDKGVGNNLKMGINSIINQLKLKKWAEVNDVDNIGEIFMAVPIEYEHVDEDAHDPNEKVGLQVASMILAIPMFFLMVLTVQFLGLDIIDEKASKSIEIIVSNISIGYHFTAKILSTLIFLFTQGVLGIIYSLVGGGVYALTTFSKINISKIKDAMIVEGTTGFVGDIAITFMDRIPSVLAVMLVFLIAGYITYSVICAVIASMSNSTEDFQQMQGPLMLIMLLSFYAAIFSYIFDGSIFIKVLGFVPLFSPMLTPILFFGESFSIIEVCISLAIIVVTNFVIVKYGLKLYRASILNYSDEKFMKRLFKIVKMSKQQ